MDWTEERIRKETGWKAFREGQSLARQQAVADFKCRDYLITGSFKQGRRALRCVVRLEGHLAVECGCRANRATGEVCAHGVALLLLAAAGTKAAAEDKHEPAPKPSSPEGELLACRIIFPQRLPHMLASGRLSAQVEREDREISQADAVFSMWLARHAPGNTYPKLLSLSADEVGEFLQTASGHPSMWAGKKPLQVLEDPLPPLDLQLSERSGERLRLKLKDTRYRSVRWGVALGAAVELPDGWQVGRLPVASPSAAWSDQAIDLMEIGELTLDLGEFVEQADAWLDLFASPPNGWLGDLVFESAIPRFSLRLEGSLNALDAELGIAYRGATQQAMGSGGASIAGLPSLTADQRLQFRDREAEQQGLKQLLTKGFKEGARTGQWLLREHESVVDFLADVLPQLEQDEQWEVRIGDRLRHVLRSLHVIRPKLENPQNLEWELSFQTDAGKLVPEAKIREMLRAGKRSAKTRSGATVVVSSSIPELVQPLLADLGIPPTSQRIQADQARNFLFRKLREKVNNKHEIYGLEERQKGVDSSELEATLRDYQEIGFRWLCERLERLGGALLADEMGLGKTIQTIATIMHFKATENQDTCLILAPRSLLGNWGDELARFAPKLRFVVLHGAGRDERRIDAEAADVVITSYGTLCRDLAYHMRQPYGMLVADEASLLRNPDSETSRSVAKLKVDRRLALTGTPVENRLRDLWALFRVIAPGYLGSKEQFTERYEGGGEPQATLGDPLERLRLRISPFVLRRTKQEVAGDLPEKSEIDEWLEMDDENKGLYVGLARTGLADIEENKGGASRMQILTLLLRLRQLCLDPRLVFEDQGLGVKTRRLKEILDERFSLGGKTLVFSHFRAYLRLFENQVCSEPGKVFRLDGSTRNRADVVRDFQAYEGPAVFLISLKAGGYGLNLTAADTVIHMDPWWNPAVEAQASDRAHRIGQTKPVTIYRLLTRGTVEERVRKMQQAKQALFDSVSNEGAPGNWTEDELRSLVSG